MNIDGVEYVRKNEAQMIEVKDHPFTIGKNIAIRTVTMLQVGKLVAVGEKELVLENAAWIADTGRFADFCKHGPVSDSAVSNFDDDVLIQARERFAK